MNASTAAFIHRNILVLAGALTPLGLVLSCLHARLPIIAASGILWRAIVCVMWGWFLMGLYSLAWASLSERARARGWAWLCGRGMKTASPHTPDGHASAATLWFVLIGFFTAGLIGVTRLNVFSCVNVRAIPGALTSSNGGSKRFARTPGIETFYWPSLAFPASIGVDVPTLKEIRKGNSEYLSIQMSLFPGSFPGLMFVCAGALFVLFRVLLRRFS